MIAKWLNSNVAAAAEMLEITDDAVLEMSNGEVRCPSPYDDSDPYEGSMADSGIFGEMGNDDALMGHIELPVPVVNIQYMYGTRPVLPRLLGMDRQKLASVIYNLAFVVTDPDGSGTEYKQVVPTKEAGRFREAHPAAVIMAGADAVSALLEKDGVREKDYIILHRLPVIPISLRYGKVKCKEQKEAWHPYHIERLYERVMNMGMRLKSLTEIGAPEIILLNERRMFQERVDALINNGAHGLPYLTPAGKPAGSLQELSEMITVMGWKPAEPSMPEYEAADMDRLRELVQELYPRTDDDAEDEDIMEETDDHPEKVEKEIIGLLRPFMDAVIRHNFPDYVQDYHDAMLQSAEWSVSEALPFLDLDKPAEPQLLDGIAGTVRTVLKKQAMYL